MSVWKSTDGSGWCAPTSNTFHKNEQMAMTAEYQARTKAGWDQYYTDLSDYEPGGFTDADWEWKRQQWANQENYPYDENFAENVPENLGIRILAGSAGVFFIVCGGIITPIAPEVGVPFIAFGVTVVGGSVGGPTITDKIKTAYYDRRSRQKSLHDDGKCFKCGLRIFEDDSIGTTPGRGLEYHRKCPKQSLIEKIKGFLVTK